MSRRGYLKTKVISGTLKGRVLTYPADVRVRPTMQRAKSSVFESLKGVLDGAVFIDLYAAGGGIGIEALSRGASRVHFVENDTRALECLWDNLRRCGIEPARGIVHSECVMEFLRHDHLRDIDPDIIFADPPYAGGETLRLLLEFFNGIDYPLKALLVLEHQKDALSLEPYNTLVRTRLRRYGQSSVSYIVLSGGDTP